MTNGHRIVVIQSAAQHPVFLTGPEFLPELREHRGRTLTLLHDAEATGRNRMIEMNTHVLTNLDRMIGEIEHDQKDARDAG